MQISRLRHATQKLNNIPGYDSGTETFNDSSGNLNVAETVASSGELGLCYIWVLGVMNILTSWRVIKQSRGTRLSSCKFSEDDRRT